MTTTCAPTTDAYLAGITSFAAVLEESRRATVPPAVLDSNPEHYRAHVHHGMKYTRVDFDTSGCYMVERSTGEIYGIKGYGVIHRGHRYGTLTTIDAWDWCGCRAVPKGA